MASSLDKTLFNMKFTAKTMEKQSKKLAKEEIKHQKKVAEFIRKNDKASARIYAQNAIRAKNESLSMLRLSARINAISTQVESALRMRALSKAMSSISKGMDSVLGTMDVSKISKMMDKFESQFESLEVRGEAMADAIDSATASSAPVEDVDALIAQVADANDLALSGDFADVPSHRVGTAAAAAPAPAAALPAGLPPPPSGGPPSGGSGGGGGGGGSAAGGVVGGGGSSGASVADDLMARLDALRG